MDRMAKVGSLEAMGGSDCSGGSLRRRAFAALRSKEAVNILFEELAFDSVTEKVATLESSDWPNFDLVTLVVRL